ncbi:ureidoglycolate lyase [Lentisphaerota bacterium ZTH]|nr:ureidoglycolate lyase [Lentisphaerota bacterium]WET05198.1 ureidoglycolate lyase [Lentisphaerota bacterium ZTH]
MDIIQLQELSLGNFKRYGSYAHLFSSSGDPIDNNNKIFSRKLLKQDLSRDSVSYSLLRIQPCEYKISRLEQLAFTAKMLMPIDGDIALGVAPPNCGTAPAVDNIEAFRIPQITLVILQSGVWHHPPFSLSRKPVNILVALPGRLYENDLTAIKIADTDQPVIKV